VVSHSKLVFPPSRLFVCSSLNLDSAVLGVARDAGEVLRHGSLVADGVEVVMSHGFLRSEPLL
jgi:hypothetical protein